MACGDLPAEYLGALMDTLDVPLVFVPGNHDPDQSGYRISRAGLITRAGFPARPPWPSGALNADGRVVDVGGLRIAGLGGCLRYGDGPNQYTERQQARRARGLRRRARWRWLRDRRGWTSCSRTPRRAASGTATTPRTAASPAITRWPPRWARPSCCTATCTRTVRCRRTLRLGRTTVRNVTGWRLFELGPDRGLAEIRPGHRHAC